MRMCAFVFGHKCMLTLLNVSISAWHYTPLLLVFIYIYLFRFHSWMFFSWLLAATSGGQMWRGMTPSSVAFTWRTDAYIIILKLIPQFKDHKSAL